MTWATPADRQVFTLVDRRYAQHFTRWDIHPVDPADLPRSMTRQLRIGRLATAIGSLLRHRRIRLLPLRRPARAPAPDHPAVNTARTAASLEQNAA